MKNVQKLIESYNNCIEKALSELASNNIQDDISNENINRIICQCDISWSVSANSELDGTIPKEIISEIKTFEDIKELYEYACTNTFYHVPTIIEDKIKELGNIGVEYLHGLLETDVIKNNIHDSGKMPVDTLKKVDLALSAIGTITIFKDDASVDALLKMWEVCNLANEVFFEKICESLVTFGNNSIDRILFILDKAEVISFKEEYLMQVFCAMNNKIKSDKVFFCLKSCFRRMQNKILGAMLLGDYGDGRAVPLLRKYAISEAIMLSKEEIFIVITVIKKLGGQTEDLINLKK